MSPFEFVILIIAILYAMFWISNIRKYVRTGRGISQQSVNIGMLFVVSVFSVILGGLSTLNLLWMYPVVWFFGTFFPFPFLNIPGKWFGDIICSGLKIDRLDEIIKEIPLEKQQYRNQKKAEIDINWIFVEDGPRGSYFISSTPITVSQYDIFCSFTGNKQPYIPGVRYGNLPIVNVTISEAEEYCKWLSQQIGKEVRLPEEDEWEFAARGGKKSKGFVYSGSNNIEEVAWHNLNADTQTHPVATKKPNELGIYDMSGNVFEWCGSKGVARGGCWAFFENLCRVGAKMNFINSQTMGYIGFRVLKEN